jgi:multimeric flavodoxin WrbA
MVKSAIKVIGVAASARRDGNSSTLLRAALDGAEAAGARTALICIGDLLFKGCQGCASCPDDGCRQRDALVPVLSALALADVWLLASPVYFDGVSGQLKAFYDRLYWFRRQGTEIRPRLSGDRRAGIIITYEDPENPYYREMASKLAGYFPGFGPFPPAEVLDFSGLGPRRAAAANREYVLAAEALGRRLVGDLTAS